MKSFTLVYRTGNRDNFQWNQASETYPTYEAAQADKDKMERQGNKALIHDTDQLNAIGMPDGYDCN